MANATKHALAGALLELLNTTTLDNITVKDIVERAQVSRQTFYYHFGDVYQLLDWAFQRAIRELGEMPEENWRDRLLMAVEFLRANRALAMNVYHSLGMEHPARAGGCCPRPFGRGAEGCHEVVAGRPGGSGIFTFLFQLRCDGNYYTLA